MRNKGLLNKFLVVFYPQGENAELRRITSRTENITPAFTIYEKYERIVKHWERKQEKANHAYTFKVLSPSTKVEFEYVYDNGNRIDLYIDDQYVGRDNTDITVPENKAGMLEFYLKQHDVQVLERTHLKFAKRNLGLK